MLRLLHISDLHFCADSVVAPLEKFRSHLNSLLPVDLEIHRAVPEVTTALEKLIQELDPDALVISGDITTLGDIQSFDFAWNWLRPLLMRKGGKSRGCIVVPGNHDVLLAQLARVSSEGASRLPWFARRSLELWLRKPITALRDLIRVGLPEGEADILHNFNLFLRKSGLVTDRMLALRLSEGEQVVLHPFCSVSVDPIWMNLGTARVQEIERLAGALRNPDSVGEGKLRILVLHHNPVSSSRKVESALVNAYNSMPAGPQFLRTLQQSGVNLILHGHQHEDACLLFDFDLNSSGHAFSVGVGSSTAKEGGSCNLITISDINHTDVDRFRFEPSFGSFRKIESMPVYFERNRPTDIVTITTRCELKRYVSGDSDGVASEMWDELQQPGADLIYLSGRRLKTVTEGNTRPLRSLLEDSPETYVRILISNPFLASLLYEELEEAPEDKLWGTSVPGLNSKPGELLAFWGRREALDDLARDSKESLDHLANFLASLSSRTRERVNVRISHTILPFAGTIRSPNRPWGKMVIKLLPVGAIGDLRMPVMKLNRRKERAMFDHYLHHMKYLLGRGRTVLGEWNRDDKDLLIEDIAPPNPSHVTLKNA